MDYEKLHVSWINISEEKLTIHDMGQNDTVERFKRAIAQKTGSPEAWTQISLHFGGEEMTNGEHMTANTHNQGLSFCQRKPSDRTESRM